jgi:hypothetical protein
VVIVPRRGHRERQGRDAGHARVPAA